jgi:hypothetical protein
MMVARIRPRRLLVGGRRVTEATAHILDEPPLVRSARRAALLEGEDVVGD